MRADLRVFTVEKLLRVASLRAATGLLNPVLNLCDLADRYSSIEDEIHRRAYLMTMDAAGGSLARWYGIGGLRTRTEVARLFRTAIELHRRDEGPRPSYERKIDIDQRAA